MGNTASNTARFYGSTQQQSVYANGNTVDVPLTGNFKTVAIGPNTTVVFYMQNVAITTVRGPITSIINSKFTKARVTGTSIGTSPATLMNPATVPATLMNPATVPATLLTSPFPTAAAREHFAPPDKHSLTLLVIVAAIAFALTRRR